MFYVINGDESGKNYILNRVNSLFFLTQAQLGNGLFLMQINLIPMPLNIEED